MHGCMCARMDKLWGIDELMGGQVNSWTNEGVSRCEWLGR